MKNIVITGINGFIGKNVANSLLAKGYVIYGCSLEKECSINNDKIFYKQLNISDRSALDKLFKNKEIDAVIHLAALVHNKGSDLSLKEYLKINTDGSKNVFESAANSGVKKILYASSVEVYGDVEQQVVDENTPCNPKTPYGISKHNAEKVLCSIHNINYAVMRFAPVYAKEFTLNIEKRIYLRPNKLAYYFKDGSYSFNFCSVHNVISFIERWLKNGTSGIYNISDSNNYSAMQIINLEKEAGRAERILKMPYTLSKMGILLIGLLRKLLGKDKKDSFFNIYNFRKLFISRVWDCQKARDLIGDKMVDLRYTFYDDK